MSLKSPIETTDCDGEKSLPSFLQEAISMSTSSLLFRAFSTPGYRLAGPQLQTVGGPGIEYSWEEGGTFALLGFPRLLLPWAYVETRLSGAKVGEGMGRRW